MIGGMIVLGLILSALAAMVLITREYDAYQTLVSSMQQVDSQRFSENMRPVFPGLALGKAFSISCSGSLKCNNYTLTIASQSIGLQVARIYINSTPTPMSSGCASLCVLDPAWNPTPYGFQAQNRYLNPGESVSITLWLPGNVAAGGNLTLPSDDYGTNTITIVTTRGRSFSFQWPIPPLGPAGGVSAGGPGGTGLYIGPLVITFQKTLIAYTKNSSGQVNYPLGGTNGHWSIPQPKLVIYIKIETDVGVPNDVYLTAQSVLELAQFNSPGVVKPFFIIAPITIDLCNSFRAKDQSIVCDPAYGYYQNGNRGDPDQIVPYLDCGAPPGQYSSPTCTAPPYSVGPRYMIPKPTPNQLLSGDRGNPVIVAFAAGERSGSSAQTGGGGLNDGNSVTSFLGLTYAYDDGSGAYFYALTLPFIAMCIKGPDSNPGTCSG
jgi:hypothetical protein